MYIHISFQILNTVLWGGLSLPGEQPWNWVEDTLDRQAHKHLIQYSERCWHKLHTESREEVEPIAAHGLWSFFTSPRKWYSKGADRRIRILQVGKVLNSLTTQLSLARLKCRFPSHISSPGVHDISNAVHHFWHEPAAHTSAPVTVLQPFRQWSPNFLF